MKVSVSIGLLRFTFLPYGYKVQDRISIGHAKQGSDLLIRGPSLPHAVPDVYPTGPKAILLCSKQDIGRSYRSIFHNTERARDQ